MRRFFNRLFSPPSPQFAFWSNAELEDLSPALAKILEVEELNRDYENVWEWLEGSSRQGFSVNIFRTHDRKQGHYDLPVVITLRWCGRRLAYEEAKEWMLKLADHLCVDVSAGAIVDASLPAEYSFRIDEVLKCRVPADRSPQRNALDLT